MYCSGAATLAAAGVADGWARTQQWTPVLAIGSNAAPDQVRMFKGNAQPYVPLYVSGVKVQCTCTLLLWGGLLQVLHVAHALSA